MLAPDVDDCAHLLRQHHALAELAATALASDAHEEMLGAACRSIAATFSADVAQIIALSDDRQSLTLRAGSGLQPGLVGRVSLPITQAGWAERVLTTGEPLVCDGSASGLPLPSYLAGHGIQVLAAAAIWPAGATSALGILAIGHRAAQGFTSLALGHLQACATLVGGAMQRLEAGSLLRQEREQLRVALETTEAEGAQSRAELAAAKTRLQTEAQQRLEAEDILRQSHKMELLGKLTAGITHDFNNLLQGICGSLELVRLRLSQGRAAEIGNFVETALSSANRAATLAGRLLTYSQHRPSEPRPSKLDELVTGMEELFRRTVGPLIRIETRNARALWPSLCDANQLESTLLDLVINARDAMPDGGTILIETANVFISRNEDDAHDVPPGEYVVLSVTDTGVGMPSNVIAQASNPFFTTKPKGQGAGLGLAMVSGLVQQLGGHLRLLSQLGSGTTATIYLPRYLGLMPVAMTSPSQTGPASVLVVDDEPGARMFVSETLADAGYTVIEAHDSRSGLHALESEARIDLLLTDIGLPGGMNGRQLAEAAVQRRPGLKVLFVTGYEEADTTRTNLLDESMLVITKPFGMDALKSTVQGIIGR